MITPFKFTFKIISSLKDPSNQPISPIVWANISIDRRIVLLESLERDFSRKKKIQNESPYPSDRSSDIQPAALSLMMGAGKKSTEEEISASSKVL